MAFVGVSQYNHREQFDEYEYDDTENFYDDAVNFGNYLDVDDSEGKTQHCSDDLCDNSVINFAFLLLLLCRYGRSQ